MDVSYYKKFEPIFGSWHIKDLIGEGSFGQVYEIERTEFGKTYKSALKAISVPQSKSEIKSLMSEGMSLSEATDYYESAVKIIVDECKLMSDLKGISNIVSYEDHMVIPHDDGVGYDILIRMELLTPIIEHTYQRPLSEEEIVSLGIDICKALEICENNNIVHRDIKLENIFVSSMGDYKLGDFGIARTLEKTVGGLSKKGTTAYMAPEVYKGEAYGAKVDIYSLGLVLYRLLNNGRIPFLPPFPEPITYDAKEMAIIRRIKGETIPPIENISPELSNVVLKACEYNPNDRFERAADFRKALEECAKGYNVVATDSICPDNQASDDYSEVTVSLMPAEADNADNSEKTEILPTAATAVEADSDDNTQELLSEGELQISEEREETAEDSLEKEIQIDEGRKSNKKIIILVAAVLLVAAVVFALLPKPVENITGIKDTVQIVLGESVAPKYEVVQKGLIRADVFFRMKDEKIATVDEDGVIHGKKTGKTDLILTAGDYEKTVTIKVISKVSEIGNVSDINIYVGDSYELKPILQPEKYSDEKISYSVDNESIATIDNNGKVTGKQIGQTTVTISAGGCSKKISVIVNQVYVDSGKAVHKKDKAVFIGEDYDSYL